MTTKGQVMNTRLSRALPKEKLEELYVTRWLTTTEIGRMFNCTRDAVVLRLHWYGIPLHGKIRGLDEESLRKLYVEKQWSTVRIAQTFGLKSDESIRKYLIKYNISRRSKSEAGRVKIMTPEHLAKLREGARKVNLGKIGEKNHNWKGGRGLNRDGYVTLRTNKKTVLEHRHVMEGVEGRPLLPWEEVNHINGIKTDNRPENLEVIYSEHKHKDWLRRHASVDK